MNDVEIGIKAIKLLNGLGYKVEIPEHVESGRAYLSKGLIRKSKELARENVSRLNILVSENTPLIGIEPSAILSFRDEYPDLVGDDLKDQVLKMAPYCLMFDEFIMREVQNGKIIQSQFSDAKQHIRLHGHCHQKALASTGPTKEMLSLPTNYTVDEIKSGCCGMAGSFGYEAEHYEVSMKVGELVLLPEVRKTPEHTIISAPGTSCRHQIKDGTGRIALHPIEVLYDALLK
jgi:Fe-S oxidoreductase